MNGSRLSQSNFNQRESDDSLSNVFLAEDDSFESVDKDDPEQMNTEEEIEVEEDIKARMNSKTQIHKLKMLVVPKIVPKMAVALSHQFTNKLTFEEQLTKS